MFESVGEYGLTKTGPDMRRIRQPSKYIVLLLVPGALSDSLALDGSGHAAPSAPHLSHLRGITNLFG